MKALDPYALNPETASTAASPIKALGAYDHHDHGVCPVCVAQKGREKAGIMSTAKLHTNDSVFFCPEHRVCMPVPV